MCKGGIKNRMARKEPIPETASKRCLHKVREGTTLLSRGRAVQAERTAGPVLQGRNQLESIGSRKNSKKFVC